MEITNKHANRPEKSGPVNLPLTVCKRGMRKSEHGAEQTKIEYMEEKTMSILKTPLFNDQGMFNSEGKQTRADFAKELPGGLKLWQKAGKPQNEYGNADNDKYYLMVETGNYITSLGTTEWRLIYETGKKQAMLNLYNGEANRGKAFDEARKGGYNPETDAIVKAMIDREECEINRIGLNPALQAQAIQKWLDGHIQAYINARDNGGQTFPDFVGAACLNEIDKCLALRVPYLKAREERDTAIRAKRKQEEAERKAAELAEDTEQLEKAISVIRNGGKIQNDELHNGNLFILLFKRYNVELPISIKGYIANKLANVTFENQKAISAQYFRTSKGQRGSATIWNYLNRLSSAILAENVPEDETGDGEEMTDEEFEHLFHRAVNA
jgi:hypothetical protein